MSTMVSETGGDVHAQLTELRQEISQLEHRNEQLMESFGDDDAFTRVSESAAFDKISLAIDDIGWQPLGMPGGEHPMTLQTIRQASDACQALSVVNPMVKNGLQIQNAYIWGHGVKVLPDNATWVTPSMRRVIGTPQAQTEINNTLRCSGNLFFLIDPARGIVQRIPMEQISGAVLRPGDAETRLYIKRTYTDFSTMLDVRFNDAPLDQANGRAVERWYATDELEGPRQASIQGVEVDQNQIMVVESRNRQFGWTWGVPDVLSVIFWTQAYKEYLENCATLAKAYARFAWKVVSSTKRGQKRTSNQLAQPPQHDSQTNTLSQVGGAVALGANQDIQALQNARSVDFNAGRPLAALIAAGLGVPITALTSDPSEGNRATAETLDEPTRLGMEMQQRMFGELIARIKRALGTPVVPVEWPDISPEPLHRIVQGLDQAGRTGMLFPKEWRKLLVESVGLDEEDLPKEPPSQEQLPAVIKNDAQPPAQSDPQSARDPELRDEPGQQASARDMM